MSRFIKSTSNEVTYSAGPNATGVVSVWAHEDSYFQKDTGIQGYLSPEDARKLAADLLNAAEAVEDMLANERANFVPEYHDEPPF